jgi:hypothetical protein
MGANTEGQPHQVEGRRDGVAQKSVQMSQAELTELRKAETRKKVAFAIGYFFILGVLGLSIWGVVHFSHDVGS